MQILDETLLFEEERDVVERRDVVNGKDLGSSDVTEHRDFGGDGERKRARTSTGDL